VEIAPDRMAVDIPQPLTLSPPSRRTPDMAFTVWLASGEDPEECGLCSGCVVDNEQGAERHLPVKVRSLVWASLVVVAASEWSSSAAWACLRWGCTRALFDRRGRISRHWLC
jgi:hypothetical protein